MIWTKQLRPRASLKRVCRMAEAINRVGKIPVRNLWLLMLYASGFRPLGHSKTTIEDNPDEIPDLVAEFLVHIVEQRIRRNLTAGYYQRHAVLSRVRGRIDIFNTERHQLLQRGKVACRFQDFTIDTPRNRYVKAALLKVGVLVTQKKLAKKCIEMAKSLEVLGVVGTRPTDAQMASEQMGRHDRNDLRMITAAKLAFNLCIPQEDKGLHSLYSPDKEEHWVRQLFEKAVVGFYDVLLDKTDWSVKGGKRLQWQIDAETRGISEILPSMQTDILLQSKTQNQRIIIDTKFTNILKAGRYRDKTLSSNYLYQMYAYLFSQRRSDDLLSLSSKGILLHPSVGLEVNETVSIQGHEIQFVTLDLMGDASQIKAKLLALTK